MADASTHLQPGLQTSARVTSVAFMLAAFPFLFIVDSRVESDLSPVLPGVAVLAVIGIMLPFILLELWQIRWRKKDEAHQERAALRRRMVSRVALVLASIWLAGWLAWGV